MRCCILAALAGCAHALRPSFDPLGLAARDINQLTNLSPVSTSRQTAVTALPSRETAAIVAAAATAATFLPEEAWAKGGEYGLAEGRIISLAHPVAMGGCFLATLYAGYTGLQWRMLRELGVELKEARAAASAAQKAVQEHAGAGASDEEALAPPPQPRRPSYLKKRGPRAASTV